VQVVRFNPKWLQQQALIQFLALSQQQKVAEVVSIKLMPAVMAAQAVAVVLSMLPSRLRVPR
jgi:hypothetical protein